MVANSFTSFSQDFQNQINFLKKERKSLIKSAKAFKKNTMPYELLMQKAKLYIDIEQNLYALRVMATKFLKS